MKIKDRYTSGVIFTDSHKDQLSASEGIMWAFALTVCAVAVCIIVYLRW